MKFEAIFTFILYLPGGSLVIVKFVTPFHLKLKSNKPVGHLTFITDGVHRVIVKSPNAYKNVY
jgi:hypothetical protein